MQARVEKQEGLDSMQDERGEAPYFAGRSNKSILPHSRTLLMPWERATEIHDRRSSDCPTLTRCASPFQGHARRSTYLVAKVCKRGMDVLMSTVGLVLLLPIFLVLAVMIKLDSPGPAFYCSERIGKYGRCFYCYKFRTMAANADARRVELSHLNERTEILFKIARDPRITTIGKLLRKYSLDELPQLWSVLRGDMSIVGPRPAIKSEVAQYTHQHRVRLEATPGMTGLWQVIARRDACFKRYISLDTEYVRHWSLALDLKILLRTIGVVFAGTGS
jgi:lipopolysaccharide/colanic/teichoic acid biosynthesis glycosyltransferase